MAILKLKNKTTGEWEEIQAIIGNGIASIEKTSTSGLVDTYTITYTNGNTTTFNVTNGEITREELEEEVERLSMIYNAFPSTTGEGEEPSINGTAEVPFKEIGLKGNTSQNGEPTLDTPIPVNVVTGDNTIIVSNNDNTQSQTYPINLGSMELCKIGDYQDYLYKENGIWYKYGAVGKVVLDGSEDENWVSNSTNQTGKNRFRSPLIADEVVRVPNADTLPQILCDYFKPATTNQTYLAQNGMAISTQGTIFVYHDLLSSLDVSGFKTWLSTHNTELYYPLATPTTEEITDTTLIEQLDNLEKAYSYDTQTNISQTNQDKPFIISYEAILSLRNVLNNLETRIAVLETE